MREATASRRREICSHWTHRLPAGICLFLNWRLKHMRTDIFQHCPDNARRVSNLAIQKNRTVFKAGPGANCSLRAPIPLPLWRNGRRERLKIVCSNTCPFESGQGHQAGNMHKGAYCSEFCAVSSADAAGVRAKCQRIRGAQFTNVPGKAHAPPFFFGRATAGFGELQQSAEDGFPGFVTRREQAKEPA
jgi:hypothetical protein